MKVFLAPLFLLLVSLSNVYGKIFFEERFLDGNIDKWTPATSDKDELGKVEYTKAEPHLDDEEDGALNTTEKAKFYRLSTPLKETIKNKGKEMCIQYSVQYPENMDCGGAYIKLIGEDFDASKFDGETPYEIMFGPDICGYETRLVHVIFSHEGKNHLIKERIHFNVDNMTHLFRLNVFPNNSFSVLVDEELRRNGTLVDEFDMLEPREIDDPEDKKPDDWVDEAHIPDPDDKKPDDWDQPETIVDTNATKPEDWNDDTDGDWTAPMIPNPDYKGEWHPKTIPNPKYKGPWNPKRIPNPKFVDDPTLYERVIKYVGIDLWQVQSGTVFDNFIISDDLKECDKHASYWRKRHEFEESLKKKSEEENKEGEEKPILETSSNFDQLQKQMEEENAKEEKSKEKVEEEEEKEEEKPKKEKEEKKDTKKSDKKHEEL